MSRRDLQLALYCSTEVLNNRRLRGQPIPKDLREYHDELEAEWGAMSVNGHESCPASDESPTIGAEEVAALLKVSPRQVRRLAQAEPRLGGQMVSGAWVFQRDAVENYASRRDPG